MQKNSVVKFVVFRRRDVVCRRFKYTFFSLAWVQFASLALDRTTPPSTAIRPFGNLPEKEATYLARTFDKAIRDSRWLEPEKGKTTTPSSVRFKRCLLEIDGLNGKCRVK